MISARFLDNEVLLITGGTGSFGNAVLRRFLQTGIGEIRILSRDEKKQDDMRKRYASDKLMWTKQNYRRFPSRYVLLFLHHYLLQGAWRAGWVGYAWSRLRSDVYRLREYKLREIRLTGRLPAKRAAGPGEPDPRVQQCE